MASIDGYCSIVAFEDGELGEVLPEAGASRGLAVNGAPVQRC